MPPPLLLPILATGLLFLIACRRSKHDFWHPSRVVTMPYFLMSLTSLAFTEDLARSFELQLSWSTMIGYTLLLSLAMIPSFFIVRPTERAVLNNPVVAPLVNLSCPLILYAAVYLASPLAVSFHRGFDSTRHFLNVERGLVIPEGPATTLAVTIASFYVIFAILLFAAIIRRFSNFHVLFLATGVGLALLHAAVFAARDGFLWAAQALLLSYWAFKTLLPDRTRRRVVLCGVIGGLVGLVYMAAVTSDRFAYSRGGYASGTVAYFGGQPYVFNETVKRLRHFYGLGLRFPTIAPAEQIDAVERTQSFQWSFGTFLTDFYCVYGWESAVGLTLLFVALSLMAFRLHQRSELGYMLAITLYVQFMVQGVFYYRLGNNAGNIYHLVMSGVIVGLWIFLPDNLWGPAFSVYTGGTRDPR